MTAAEPERLLRHRYRVRDGAVESLTMAEALAKWLGGAPPGTGSGGTAQRGRAGCGHPGYDA